MRLSSHGTSVAIRANPALSGNGLLARRPITTSIPSSRMRMSAAALTKSRNSDRVFEVSRPFPRRDRATVWRGARRNPGKRGYRHGQARRRAEARRCAAPSVPGKMTPDLWRMVEERLALGWSPERISGRLRK